MAESTFSTRHYGASVCCTGTVTMVHTFASLVSEVEVIEGVRGPLCVKIIKDSPFSSKPNDGMTVVHIDWPTACQIAEAVSHRLEEPEHEAICVHCGEPISLGGGVWTHGGARFCIDNRVDAEEGDVAEPALHEGQCVPMKLVRP